MLFLTRSRAQSAVMQFPVPHSTSTLQFLNVVHPDTGLAQLPPGDYFPLQQLHRWCRHATATTSVTVAAATDACSEHTNQNSPWEPCLDNALTPTKVLAHQSLSLSASLSLPVLPDLQVCGFQIGHGHGHAPNWDLYVIKSLFSSCVSPSCLKGAFHLKDLKLRHSHNKGLKTSPNSNTIAPKKVLAKIKCTIRDAHFLLIIIILYLMSPNRKVSQASLVFLPCILNEFFTHSRYNFQSES